MREPLLQRNPSPQRPNVSLQQQNVSLSHPRKPSRQRRKLFQPPRQPVSQLGISFSQPNKPFTKPVMPSLQLNRRSSQAAEPLSCGDRLSRARQTAIRQKILNRQGFPVFAPHAAQAVADFADRRVGFDAGEDMRQEIFRAACGLFKTRERGFDA